MATTEWLIGLIHGRGGPDAQARRLQELLEEVPEAQYRLSRARDEAVRRAATGMTPAALAAHLGLTMVEVVEILAPESAIFLNDFVALTDARELV